MTIGMNHLRLAHIPCPNSCHNVCAAIDQVRNKFSFHHSLDVPIHMDGMFDLYVDRVDKYRLAFGDHVGRPAQNNGHKQLIAMPILNMIALCSV